MTSPYQSLPPEAFWRTGVSQRAQFDTAGLYTRRFRISRKARIVTAGSCFAQHVGRTLRKAGFNILDAEPGPALPPAVLSRFGYGLYSGRYGNIYTARQLAQLLAEAFDGLQPAEPVWEKDGRFYDAFRPSVEPEGLASPEEVLAHRADHLAAVRRLFSDLDVFVFTFGLTEAWVAKTDGTVYPTAPGTIAGTFDPERHAFHNYRYNEILKDFRDVRKRIRKLNPKARFLVTVSPVPLTATASGRHVEVATAYSKAVLRAVCGALYEDFRDVDYFPSYEVITSQLARGQNYEPNLRAVSEAGVERAMGLFMAAHGGGAAAPPAPAPASAEDETSAAEDVVCEDVLLESFAR